MSDNLIDAKGKKKIRVLPQGPHQAALRAALAGAWQAVVLAAPPGQHDPQPDVVVMTADDYLALIDNTEDAAATRSYVETQRQEAVPIELADRLLAGENPVRVWREYRGLSLTALAEKAELSKSYLSQIETGERTGPVDTMRQIARALAVDLDDLI